MGVREELEPQEDGQEQVGEAEHGGAVGAPDDCAGDGEAEEEVDAVEQQDRALLRCLLLRMNRRIEGTRAGRQACREGVGGKEDMGSVSRECLR